MASSALKAVVVRSCLVIAVLAGAGRAEVITWTGGGSDDSWRNADNWDLARIPGPDDDVVIDLPGDYQVVLGGSMTVASLDIAAVGATLRLEGGTQGFDALLTITNGCMNEGTIVLVNADTYYVRNVRLDVSTGALVNNGTINVNLGSNGGSRFLGAAIDNRGAVNINTTATIDMSGGVAHGNSGDINVNGGTLKLKLQYDTLTNTGTVTVSAGRKLEITDGTWNQNSGSIVGAGVLSMKNTDLSLGADLALSSLSSVTLESLTVQGIGALTNAVRLTLVNSAISTPFTNQGDTTVRGTNNTVGSAPGEFVNDLGATLRVEGPGDTTLTATNGCTNNGTVILTNSDSFVRNMRLDVTNGALVNNGIIEAQLGSAGGSRFINAAIDNRYMIYIKAPTTIDKSGAASHINSGDINVSGGHLTLKLNQDEFTQTGSIVLSGGRKLIVDGGTWNHYGGALYGSGELSMTGTAITLGADFHPFPASVLLQSVTMQGPTTFRNETSLTMVDCTISTALMNMGDISVRGTTTVESDSGAFINDFDSALRLEGPGDTTLIATNGCTNDGTIVLTNSDSFVRTVRFDCTSGTLLNNGTIDVYRGSSGGSRRLGAAIDNQGTININTDTTVEKSGTALHVNSGAICVAGGKLTLNLSQDELTNNGAITIGANRELSVIGGTWTHNAGSVGGDGHLSVSGTTLELHAGLLIPDSTTATLNGVTVNAPGTLTNAGVLKIINSTIAAPFTNEGTLHAMAANTIASGPGAFVNAEGALTQVLGDPQALNAILTATDGCTNNGRFVLVNGDTFSRNVRLDVANGMLVNKGGIEVLLGASGGNRFIDAAIDNQGTIDIKTRATIDKSGAATHVNAGQINVTGGDLTLNLTDDTFENTGPVEIGSSRILQVNNGTWLHLHGASVDGSGTWSLRDANLHGEADTTFAHLYIPETLALSLDHCWYSSRWILENRGTVTIIGSTITGSLDNWGLLIARGTNTITSDDGSCVNLPTGVMRLEAAPGSFDSTLWVTNGLDNFGSFVMTNTDSFTRTVRLNVLNGAFMNKGTVNTWYASGGGNRVFDAEINNQGTFNINSGQATVERNGTAHHVNSGTIYTGGNLTFKLAQDTFTNTGTCRVAAARTLELTQGVFTNFAERTLTGGTYHVLGKFKFAGADVANNAAHLILDGNEAAIVDHLNTDVTNHLSTNAAEGVLELLNGAWIAVDPNESSNFHNTGQVLLRDTSSLAVGGHYFETSGLTQLAGGTISTGNGLSIAEQGVLGGHGTIFGPVINAGTISPGPINGHLTIEGVLTLLPTSDLVIDIRGPIAGLEYDLIDVHMLDLLDGSATLEGSLHVNLIGGYRPTIGTEFSIVTAEAVQGVFRSRSLPLHFSSYDECREVDYRPNAAVLVTLSEGAFVEHPQSQIVCEGQPVTFSAGVTLLAGNLHSALGWYRDGVFIEGSSEEDVQATYYTIDAVTLEDEGIYSAGFSNMCGYDFSEPATLRVLEPGLGDFDRDCDRDLGDYYFFMHLCQTSPNQQHGTECGVFDFDEDQDVDLHDFAEFELRFGQP